MLRKKDEIRKAVIFRRKKKAKLKNEDYNSDEEKEKEKELNTINPTHVFCFIGRTHGSIDDKIYTTIDYLEQPGKLVDNIRDNLFSPITLAKICENNNIHLI